MNFQNIDLSFLSFEKEKAEIPNWVSWILFGLGSLLVILILIALIYSPQKDNLKKKVISTPTPQVSPKLSPPEKKSEVELLRLKWLKAKQVLKQNNYDDELLQPPLVEFDLQLND